jgi:hypothetical protein
MIDMSETRKRLRDILGEDRELDDNPVSAVTMFGPDDLEALRRVERDTVLRAFAEAARTSRDARGAGAAEAGDRPRYMARDMEQGLAAARAALEAFPAGERSEKAQALLADCHCPPPGG